MASDPPMSYSERRVLRFRRGGAGAPTPQGPPASDLSEYQNADGADDYHHRMIVNALVFLFVMALIGAGLWLADTMAAMRKNEDCVLSGRRGCTPVEYNRQRW